VNTPEHALVASCAAYPMAQRPISTPGL